MLAEALAVLVCFVPALSQMSYTAYQRSLALPDGEEATDDDLKEVEGVRWPILAAAAVALAVPAAYCVIEVMHDRIPRRDVALALLGVGTLFTVVVTYASVRAVMSRGGSESLLMDHMGPYRARPSENATRWRF